MKSDAAATRNEKTTEKILYILSFFREFLEKRKERESITEAMSAPFALKSE